MNNISTPRSHGSMLYLLFCCFASALGGLLFGYDLFVISYPSLKRANEKSPGNSGRAGFGFSNEANDGGVINQRLASPVLTNLTEDAVLDRIPLRACTGIIWWFFIGWDRGLIHPGGRRYPS
jgi:hypothetical protein